MNIKKLNEELQKYLEEVPSEYEENLENAKEFCTYYICPELKRFAKDYCNKQKGLYGPNFDKLKFEMLDSYCAFTNLNLFSLSAGELIDEEKQAFLKRLKADIMNNLERLFKECCKKLEEHLGFKCIEEIICDTNGNFAELGIVLGGSQLYGKE